MFGHLTADLLTGYTFYKLVLLKEFHRCWHRDKKGSFIESICEFHCESLEKFTIFITNFVTFLSLNRQMHRWNTGMTTITSTK